MPDQQPTLRVEVEFEDPGQGVVDQPNPPVGADEEQGFTHSRDHRGQDGAVGLDRLELLDEGVLHPSYGRSESLGLLAEPTRFVAQCGATGPLQIEFGLRFAQGLPEHQAAVFE